METRKFGIWDNGTAIIGHFYGPATGTADRPVVQLLDTETHRFNLAYFEVFDPYKIVVNGELLPSIFLMDSLQTKPPYTLTLKRESGADDLTALPEGIYPLGLAYTKMDIRWNLPEHVKNETGLVGRQFSEWAEKVYTASNMKVEEYKPCPKCGGKDFEVYFRVGFDMGTTKQFIVRCQKFECQFESPPYGTAAEAIKAWD
jgi:hypothetical protein